MSTAGDRYLALCQRLGVKPKQFGVLAGSAAIAVGFLGLRFLVPLAQAEAAPAAAPAPAAPAAASASAPAPAARASAYPHGLPSIVEMALEDRPLRDPFVPVLAAGQPQGGSLVDRAYAAMGGSGPPRGIKLQATLNGTMSIIDGTTYRVGDSLTDGEGRVFVLRSVAERSIRVADSSAEWTLSMGGPLGGPPGPDG